MNFRCPNPECRVKLKAKSEQAGRRFRCPKCKTVVTVPAAEETGSGASQAVSVAKTDLRQAVSAVETGSAATISTPQDVAGSGQDGLLPWQSGKELLDDYEVEKQLGHGGMGDVYLVRSRSAGEQFAVKRILPKLLRNQRSRKAFLNELRTWIDLPEHPNLTACRFFRTAEDQVLVFAEYVEGGSLEEWLGTERLSSLEKVLDVAIQFAWGLETAHARGLVHQDVKPANVLMTPEGVPKVTDFGLAKARAVIETLEAGGQSGSSSGEADETAVRQASVTGAAGTPAYQSPEQATRERLSEKTDLWSWGLSVLAMFFGERTWKSGVGAPRVLEGRLKAAARGEEGAFRVPMPASVADVLRRCFQRQPADRWPGMARAADALAAVYQQERGRPYPRERPAVSTTAAAAPHDRRTKEGAAWTDPHEWLEKALKAAGRDPAEADRLIQTRTGSRQAQAIDDLIAYEEALGIYTRLIASGRKDLEPDLATLCMEKAFVHGSAGDMPGQVAMYDRAIEIRERLVHQEGRRELANELAGCYVNKAAAVSALGDERAAVELYDRAIELYERLVHQEGRRELANVLADCYMNKGVSLKDLGDHQAAVELYDRAIEIYERLVHQEGRRELANVLARCYMNKAVSVRALGDNRQAVELYDQAIEVYERLVHQEGRRELANDLAYCYMNKANAVAALGDHRAAVELYDRAIEIYERLVHQEGRRELAHDLARCYMNKAASVRALGDHRAAVELYDRAIEIRERLVHQEGRRELANDLAHCYVNKAIAVKDLGDNRAAVELYDRAIKIRERLVRQEGRRELAGDLARVQLYWANAANKLGRRDEAARVARQAIETLQSEVQRTGRADLQGVMDWARQNLAELL